LTVVLVLLAGCASTASTTPFQTRSAAPSGSPGAGSPATAPSASGPRASARPSGPAKSPKASASTGTGSGKFRLSSTSFGQNGAIPAQFTCHGADRSPPLAWSGTPAGTKALVLLVVDPDANQFVHWTVLDLKPTTTGLPRGVAPTATAIQQGRNDFGNVGYGGPCPPSGTHHYRFTLSALAAPLQLSGHPSGSAVRTALAAAKVLGRATLIGTSKA
jgi:Raf kinase inhibitor-like YbhB/YbcL family protein